MISNGLFEETDEWSIFSKVFYNELCSMENPSMKNSSLQENFMISRAR